MSDTHRVPIATLLLIAANIAAAFWVFLDPGLVEGYGFVLAQPSVLTVFTGLFLHQNLLHLFGNMLFLAAVGPAVEFAAGSWRFLIVYFAGGLMGVLVHSALISPAAAAVPLVGASGCIAACAAYYTIRYISLRVLLGPNLAVPILFVTALWVVLQASGAFVHIGFSEGGIAYWSHLGGFGAGLILSLTFRAPKLATIQMGHEVLDRMNERGPAAALHAAERILEKHPQDARALSYLAEAHGALGDHEKEAKCLVRLLHATPTDSQPAVIERMDALGALGILPAMERMQLADRLKASSPPSSRALLVSVARGPSDNVQRPEALLALAALDRDDRPEDAAAWLQQLADDYALHPAAEHARSRGWLP